ncbi:hypothetical protein L227DRAFT_564734 [Lentinus tigrinus ALCF2SS1-6]|uniref:Uncharacterized protein n=1 Tax=Lentinus tigrinus ALCF2SS1-6 TaxID=1328759 RepID=A0A5C2S6M4_9APHY|nr:hypothetical protein L227DRAFT_564734 [Lentinus tigrinus ALCF2SS1-6]
MSWNVARVSSMLVDERFLCCRGDPDPDDNNIVVATDATQPPAPPPIADVNTIIVISNNESKSQESQPGLLRLHAKMGDLGYTVLSSDINQWSRGTGKITVKSVGRVLCRMTPGDKDVECSQSELSGGILTGTGDKHTKRGKSTWGRYTPSSNDQEVEMGTSGRESHEKGIKAVRVEDKRVEKHIVKGR